MQPHIITMMVNAAIKAAKGLVRDFGEIGYLQTSLKGPNKFVAVAEQRTESMLHDALHSAYPSYNFLMEKTGFTEYGDEDERLWIISPIDGIENFLHGLPYFALSITLKERNKIIAGLVYDPLRNEFFWSYQGMGAFLNQTRLRISGRNIISHSYLATKFSCQHQDHKKLTVFSNIAAAISSVRICGTTSLDLAYVAAGRYDGFWGYAANLWDMAAGTLLIKEAKGFISDHAGDDNSLTTGDIITGNELIHQFLLRQFSDTNCNAESKQK